MNRTQLSLKRSLRSKRTNAYLKFHNVHFPVQRKIVTIRKNCKDFDISLYYPCSKMCKLQDFFTNHTSFLGNENHVVKKCFHRPSSIYLAIKFIHIYQCTFYDPVNETRFKNLKTEIDNFRKLEKSPNIVDFYGLCLYENEALICMELMDMSLYDLYLVVHDKKETFPEAILGYIAVQVLEALGFCEKHSFIHRDVKPKNILLNTRGEVKLCDFGSAKVLVSFCLMNDDNSLSLRKQ